MERKQQNTVPSNNSKETTRKGKRFVRYKAGAEMYSISQKKFERLPQFGFFACGVCG